MTAADDEPQEEDWIQRRREGSRPEGDDATETATRDGDPLSKTVGRVVILWLGLTAASFAPVTAVEAAYVGRGLSVVQQAAVVTAFGVAYWLHRRRPTVRADVVVTFGATALGAHLGLTRLVAPAVTVTRGSVYPTVRATLFAVAALTVGYAAAVTLTDAGGPRGVLAAVTDSLPHRGNADGPADSEVKREPTVGATDTAVRNAEHEAGRESDDE